MLRLETSTMLMHQKELPQVGSIPNKLLTIAYTCREKHDKGTTMIAKKLQ